MPWVAGAVALAGLAQTVVGGIKAKKAREEMEKMKSPTAKPDTSVSRYYNEALRRYNTAPTSTFAYKNMLANINRNQAQGLSALKDRRSLIGGVSNIVGRSNDAALNAASIAEREQANRFNVLGNASARKTADDRYLFNQNQLAPYQQKLTLTGMRAQANAQIMNSGLSNIYSGLSSYASMKNANASTKPPTNYVDVPGITETGSYGGFSPATAYDSAIANRQKRDFYNTTG